MPVRCGLYLVDAVVTNVCTAAWCAKARWQARILPSVSYIPAPPPPPPTQLSHHPLIIHVQWKVPLGQSSPSVLPCQCCLISPTWISTKWTIFVDSYGSNDIIRCRNLSCQQNAQQVTAKRPVGYPFYLCQVLGYIQTKVVIHIGYLFSYIY